jgi:hypothetical protein
LLKGTPKARRPWPEVLISAGAVDHLLEDLSKEMDRKQNRERLFARALEYERLAQDTLDPVAQRTYRDMARQWRELAEQAVTPPPDAPAGR